MTTPLTNSQIVTPGSGTSSNIIGTNVLLNANIDMQQAFLNMLADISAEVAAFAKFQNEASDEVNGANFGYFKKYMEPVLQDEAKGGANWIPSQADKINMEMYQTKTQESNANGQAINQSVSTDSSADTNLMQGVQSDSSNFTTL